MKRRSIGMEKRGSPTRIRWRLEAPTPLPSRLAVLGPALAWLAAAGCSSVVSPPADPGEVRVVLAESGGIAGVDWQVTIDGGSGTIVGDRCRADLNCDWSPGETLANVAEEDLRTLVDAFLASGFFDGPRNFGSQCCDQFDYVLSYADDDDDREVSGSDGTLPESLLALIQTVRQFVEDARD